MYKAALKRIYNAFNFHYEYILETWRKLKLYFLDVHTKKCKNKSTKKPPAFWPKENYIFNNKVYSLFTYKGYKVKKRVHQKCFKSECAINFNCILLLSYTMKKQPIFI